MDFEKEFTKGDERIIYSIEDGENIRLDRLNNKLKEYFIFEIEPNQKIFFRYFKYLKISGSKKTIMIDTSVIENPLSYKYTYENVKEYLFNENISNEQKIDYIITLLEDYLQFYLSDKYLRVWSGWLK